MEVFYALYINFHSFIHTLVGNVKITQYKNSPTYNYKTRLKTTKSLTNKHIHMHTPTSIHHGTDLKPAMFRSYHRYSGQLYCMMCHSNSVEHKGTCYYY